MNWRIDPEPTNGKDNIADVKVTNRPKISGPPILQNTGDDKPNNEITELLICHGAKCTCDKAFDPSPK